MRLHSSEIKTDHYQIRIDKSENKNYSYDYPCMVSGCFTYSFTFFRAVFPTTSTVDISV